MDRRGGRMISRMGEGHLGMDCVVMVPVVTYLRTHLRAKLIGPSVF